MYPFSLRAVHRSALLQNLLRHLACSVTILTTKIELQKSASDLVEYHKWKLNADWFAPITSKFVIRTHGEFGFLGSYNKDLGLPPFERFYVGGDGLTNFVIDGREIIGLARLSKQLNYTQQVVERCTTSTSLEARYIIANTPSHRYSHWCLWKRETTMIISGTTERLTSREVPVPVSVSSCRCSV